ncbi:hypothetical protein BH18ACI2_BH18ACI2_30690 [soil metagenome]
MSKFNLTAHQAGHVVLLDFEGMITFGEGSVALRQAIRHLITEGRTNILLSLAKVHAIDSAGLGELVSAFVTVQRAGGQLNLLKVTEAVQDLMALTKILTVFEIYDDELAALNSFSLGDDYILVPYDGEISWADEDVRMLNWTKTPAR